MPTPSLGDFAICVCSLVALVVFGERVVALINGVKELRKKPQHRRVPARERFVTKAELKEVRMELSAHIKEVEGSTGKQLRDLQEQMHAIGLKVTAIAVKTGADKLFPPAGGPAPE